MPVAGGTTRKVVESRLRPFQQLIPLLVAFEFPAGVDQKRVRSVEDINLDAVVDHQVHRHQGIHLVGRIGVAGHGHYGVSHGGQGPPLRGLR